MQKRERRKNDLLRKTISLDLENFCDSAEVKYLKNTREKLDTKSFEKLFTFSEDEAKEMKNTLLGFILFNYLSLQSLPIPKYIFGYSKIYQIKMDYPSFMKSMDEKKREIIVGSKVTVFQKDLFSSITKIGKDFFNNILSKSVIVHDVIIDYNLFDKAFPNEDKWLEQEWGKDKESKSIILSRINPSKSIRESLRIYPNVRFHSIDLERYYDGNFSRLSIYIYSLGNLIHFTNNSENGSENKSETLLVNETLDFRLKEIYSISDLLDFSEKDRREIISIIYQEYKRYFHSQEENINNRIDENLKQLISDWVFKRLDKLDIEILKEMDLLVEDYVTLLLKRNTPIVEGTLDADTIPQESYLGAKLLNETENRYEKLKDLLFDIDQIFSIFFLVSKIFQIQGNTFQNMIDIMIQTSDSIKWKDLIFSLIPIVNVTSAIKASSLENVISTSSLDFSNL